MAHVRADEALSEVGRAPRPGLGQRNVSIEDVDHVITERRGFEEVVVHLDGEAGRVERPLAIVADREPDGRIDELRIYHSSWPLTGRHANRPPVLQPDRQLREPDVVADYDDTDPPLGPSI